jgi:hypothetical protein
MFYVNIHVFKVQIFYNLIPYKAFYCNFSITIPAVPGCTIHVDTHFTVPALITTDPEDEPSVSKHIHVEDTVKIKMKFISKRCILLVYII